MSIFKIIQADWHKDKNLLIEIRSQVFIMEQKVPPELELDELDISATHFLAYTSTNKAIGTARLLISSNSSIQNSSIQNSSAQIGRMAVLKEYRKQGCGLALLQACLQWARKQQFREVILHAQNHAIPFYQKSGFNIRGSEFMDAGIPHHEMVLMLE